MYLCLCVTVYVSYSESCHLTRQPVVGLALPLVRLVPLTHIVFHLQHHHHYSGDDDDDGGDDDGVDDDDADDCKDGKRKDDKRREDITCR